jgi:hypothetical protein
VLIHSPQNEPHHIEQRLTAAKPEQSRKLMPSVRQWRLVISSFVLGLFVLLPHQMHGQSSDCHHANQETDVRKFNVLRYLVGDEKSEKNGHQNPKLVFQNELPNRAHVL